MGRHPKPITTGDTPCIQPSAFGVLELRRGRGERAREHFQEARARM